VQQYVTDQFEGLGANLLTVSTRRPSSGIIQAVQPLTTEDVDAMASLDPASISAVAASYQVQTTVAAGGTSVSVRVSGVTANYADVNGWYAQTGTSFITQENIDDNAYVVVLGTTTVEDLFGSADYDVIGLPIQVSGRTFTVIGVMEAQDAIGFQDPNEVAFVPITVAQTRLAHARVASGGYQVSAIQVLATAQDTIETASQSIEAYLMKAHEIDQEEDADFSVSNRSAILESITQTTSLLTIFLSAIAAISLLVGGIGVMNIMLVSVSERTREIGLRKAVGARWLDIMAQFLIESVLLSLGGGLVGILIGWLLMRIGGQLVEGISLVLTPDVALLATGVSSLIGIFFGLYPANRAASMRPIDALRYE
ncbi:MAG: ABC transporter permease, partial [Anaerolineae bacterium]|nr:ABC transporter permease [Anaerolineae bacterium]